MRKKTKIVKCIEQFRTIKKRWEREDVGQCCTVLAWFETSNRCPWKQRISIAVYRSIYINIATEYLYNKKFAGQFYLTRSSAQMVYFKAKIDVGAESRRRRRSVACF